MKIKVYSVACHTMPSIICGAYTTEAEAWSNLFPNLPLDSDERKFAEGLLLAGRTSDLAAYLEEVAPYGWQMEEHEIDIPLVNDPLATPSVPDVPSVPESLVESSEEKLARQRLAMSAYHPEDYPSETLDHDTVENFHALKGDTLALFIWREVGDAGCLEDAAHALDVAVQELAAVAAKLQAAAAKADVILPPPTQP